MRVIINVSIVISFLILVQYEIIPGSIIMLPVCVVPIIYSLVAIIMRIPHPKVKPEILSERKFCIQDAIVHVFTLIMGIAMMSTWVKVFC